MPNLYDPVQVQTLIDSNGKLDGSIEELRVDLRSLRSQQRTLRIIVWALVGVLGLLGFALAQARSTAADLRGVVNGNQADRVANTAAACVQFNVQRGEQRAAIKDGILTFARNPADLTPGEQELFAAYSDVIDARLPFRDCSPEGLERYFKDPPVDPATR